MRSTGEHFEDLLNLSTMSTFEEAEPEDSEEDKSINMAEVTEVIKISSCTSFAPRCRRFWMSWLTLLSNVTRWTGTTPMEWQTKVMVPINLKEDQRVCWEGPHFSLHWKVYSRMLDRRLRPCVALVLSWNSGLDLHPCKLLRG